MRKSRPGRNRRRRHPWKSRPLANLGASTTSASSVFYALARNGLAPRPLARTHPRFKTPNIAIISLSIFAGGLALLFGWKWGPLDGFFTIATMAVPVVIIVYMLISVGCMRYYLGPGRAQFNVLLHVVLPISGIVLFFFPLYYQFYKYPPDGLAARDATREASGHGARLRRRRSGGAGGAAGGGAGLTWPSRPLTGSRVTR